MLLEENGDLVIADRLNLRVRKIESATGIITTVAGNGQLFTVEEDDLITFGDGLPATEATVGTPDGLAIDSQGNLLIVDGFSSPLGLAFDADGNLFISTSNNRVRRVDAQTQIITTVAGTGDIGALGDNGPALEATLSLPFGIVLDVQGNLFIADRFNNRIRAVRGPIE